MSVAKIIELVGSSDKSFEDAVKHAITAASKTVRGIRGADVKGMTVKIKDGKIIEYRANVKISFGVE
jgi:flavin-binding protein dodecin